MPRLHFKMAVLLETSKGDLVIDLYAEECPLATKNFLKLCKWVVSSAAVCISAPLASLRMRRPCSVCIASPQVAKSHFVLDVVGWKLICLRFNTGRQRICHLAPGSLLTALSHHLSLQDQVLQ